MLVELASASVFIIIAVRQIIKALWGGTAEIRCQMTLLKVASHRTELEPAAVEILEHFSDAAPVLRLYGEHLAEE